MIELIWPKALASTIRELRSKPLDALALDLTNRLLARLHAEEITVSMSCGHPSVRVENEGHQDIEVRSVIERGGESRIIDLKGNTRRIKRVAFVYRTIPGFDFEKAEVTLWGEK